MAFMSLAAFAETDISSDPKVSMSTANVTYGAGIAPAIQMLYDGYKMTTTDDYTWDGNYYTTSACTAVAKDDTETPYTIDNLPAGTYWVKVTGKGVYTGTRSQSFEVLKAAVTVDLVGGNLEKVFGAADPALTAGDIDWTTAVGFVGTDDENVFNLTSLTYTHEGVNASAVPYPVTVTGATADNYTLTINGGILITPKAIAAGMITSVTLSEKYKGAVFTEFAVNIKDGSTPLVAGTDFVLGAYTAADLATPASPKNVGTYYLGITNKADANYSVAAATLVGTFEIEQAGLTVRALNQTKVYNGDKVLPNTADLNVAYQLIGVQGADVFAAPTLAVDGDATVGDKTITPSYAVENPNYDYNYVTGTLTITKRALSIKANNSSKVYKKNDPAGYAGVTYTPTLGVGEVWAVPAGDITKMTSTAPATGNGQLKVVRTGKGTDEDKGTYVGALTLTRNASAAIWDNYDVTLVPGDFEITGGKLYITALHQSKNYGEADPDWTAVEEKAGNVNPNYRVDGISNPDVVTGVTLTCTHDEAVGTYTINIDATGVPSGYEEIVFVPATFKINKRPLAIVAKPQTLKIGDTEANLDQNAYTIINTEANEGLLDTDDASDVFTLGFKAGIASPLVAHAPYADGIAKVDGAKAGNYAITFSNGKLIVIDPDATIVLNRPAKAAYTATPALDNAATVIATAAADKYTAAEANAYNGGLLGAVAEHFAAPADYNEKVGAAPADPADLTEAEADAYNATLPGAVTTADVQKKFVTFSDFSMIAEKWYPIVLPFATSVKEVSEAFGYAIVNVLKKDNTDATKIAFKLHMGNIPANEPFVVKVYEDVNMNEVTFGDGWDPTTAKTIVNSAAPEVADASGVKFIGSYSHKEGFAANEAFFSVNAAKNDYYWGSASNTTYMAPLGAYFQIPAGSAPRSIEFEEADGSTTAIEAVSTVNEVKNNEGWYTINGVKLQAAPAQKGIYILNGKKVVVK